MKHPPDVTYRELEKIALLSIVLPTWKFDYYHGVTRDAEDNPPLPDPKLVLRSPRRGSKAEAPVLSPAEASKIENPKSEIENKQLFLVELQKSVQNSSFQKAPIPAELHGLRWMDSWQEPEFTPLFPLGDPPPKKYYAVAFDEFGWLSETQWALLAPLLPAQPLEKPRGRPTASSHAVITAILWKTAFGFSWDDFSGRQLFPPKRTCRRYYKRWLLSGRLMTIYKVLLNHLLQYVHPFDFIRQNYFDITEDNLIVMVPGVCPDVWQTRTALLFMQETYAVIRRLRREEKNNYFPYPSMCKELVEQYLISMFRRPVHDARS